VKKVLAMQLQEHSMPYIKKYLETQHPRYNIAPKIYILDRYIERGSH
jgi:hypothetical protein